MTDDIKKKLKITAQHDLMYDEMLKEMIDKAVVHDPQMVASVFLALGLKMYRSCLTKESFQELLNEVCSTAVNIEPFGKESKKESIH